MLERYGELTVAAADIRMAARACRAGKNREFLQLALAPCDGLDTDALAGAALQGMEALLAYVASTPYSEGAPALQESLRPLRSGGTTRPWNCFKARKSEYESAGPLFAYAVARRRETDTVRIHPFRQAQRPAGRGDPGKAEGDLCIKSGCWGTGTASMALGPWGWRCSPWKSPEAGARPLRRLAEEGYAVLYVTEALCAQIPEEIVRLRERPLPAVVPIPGISGNTGMGMQQVKRSVEQAVGSDILENES